MSRSALIYTALGAIAIAVAGFVLLAGFSVAPTARTADTTAIAALREGEMKKLVFHATPVAVSDAAFVRADGGQGYLADYKGKHILLNFWATWCAPCRKEMPMLAELQTEMGGDAFEVVTLATGRNAPPAMKRFFDEIGVTNLPLHTDPKQAVARDMGVLGLPITVILNPEGMEIARLRGDADWNSDSAKAIVRALIDG